VAGDFSSLAHTNFGDVSHTFAVDAKFLGQGLPPSRLDFFINRFGDNPNGEGTQIEAGTTAPAIGVPEPRPASTALLGLAATLAYSALRRRRPNRRRASTY
jgi:hypothetical protein